MHIQVTIPTVDFQEVLIALLAEMGYEGFEQEDDRLQAFAGETAFDEAALRELLTAHGLSYSLQRIEERNWNEEWEATFQPVVVEGFCAIRAHFHAPMPEVEHELIITPKMSFGTGHHATTYMMLQAMRGVDMRGKRVLDFGTGTGVLAILAERLGAGHVVAIDNDDWSIDNAQENVAANGCTRIEVLKRDAVGALGRAQEEAGIRAQENSGGHAQENSGIRTQEDPGPRAASLAGPFDVILANINKHVILKQLGDMAQQLKKGGVILLSGLLSDDAEDIENEAAKNNLSISERIAKGSWICFKTGKKPK
jgi:ribosomal protein L11 methyltransferase